jgi:hypothetical protein
VYYVCNDDSVDENLGPLFVYFLLFQSNKTIPNDVKGCYSRKLKSTKISPMMKDNGQVPIETYRKPPTSYQNSHSIN